MTTEQLEKYLNFLLTEIYRYQDDFDITYDEINWFMNEVNHLKDLVNDSEILDSGIKRIVNGIRFTGNPRTRTFGEKLTDDFNERFNDENIEQKLNKSAFEDVEADIKTLLYGLMLKKK